jgi:predicted dehydrogenase
MKKNNIVKFGLLGLGRVVENRVYRVFKNELKNSKIVSVFDKNNKKNEKYSKLFNLKKKTSLKNFLSVDTDYIYIATESGNHARDIKQCFDANKNVIVEKPPTLRIHQLTKLNRIANKKKLKFYAIYQNRLNNSVDYLKKQITRKFIKDTIFVNLKLLWCREQSYYNDWHGKWLYDGGVIAQQGIHYIDLLCYFFGDPVECVSVVSNKSNKLQAEDTHLGMIKFKNQIVCQISLTTALRPNDFQATIEVFQKEKQIQLHGLCCNKINIIHYNSKDKKNSKLLRKFSENVPTGYGLSHRKVFQNIIDYDLKKDRKKPLKAIDTLNTLKLLQMMYKSSEKKSWIKIKDKNLNSKLGK